jgi:hypothetical protein
LSVLQVVFQDYPIDLSLVEEGWEEKYSTKENDSDRAARVGQGLWELSKETLRAGGGEWKGIKFPSRAQGVGDVEIIVVTHGGLLESVVGGESYFIISLLPIPF